VKTTARGTEKQEKLIALALDPAATNGEAVNALFRFPSSGRGILTPGFTGRSRSMFRLWHFSGCRAEFELRTLQFFQLI
jgi:hypothetical protein